MPVQSLRRNADISRPRRIERFLSESWLKCGWSKAYPGSLAATSSVEHHQICHENIDEPPENSQAPIFSNLVLFHLFTSFPVTLFTFSIHSFRNSIIANQQGPLSQLGSNPNNTHATSLAPGLSSAPTANPHPITVPYRKIHQLLFPPVSTQHTHNSHHHWESFFSFGRSFHIAP